MKTKSMKKVETRLQKRAKRTGTKLIKAALNVVCEKGKDAAIIEEIIIKADVGKGTLYQYFTNNEKMVITLTANMLSRNISYL